MFLFLTLPALIIWLCTRVNILNKVGTVILCYFVGMLLGNTTSWSQDIQAFIEVCSGIFIGISLPLLLFSLNVRSWIQNLAKNALLSMGFAILSVTLVTSTLVILFYEQLPADWQLAGMAIAVYTGGTPNLAAMKSALAIDTQVFILFHTYDTILTLVYILFLISAGKHVFNQLLPKFKFSYSNQQGHTTDLEGIYLFKGLFRSHQWYNALIALLLTTSIFIVAYILSQFFSPVNQSTVMIISISILGIAMSFHSRIVTLPHTFQLGLYFIYSFCITVGSQTHFDALLPIQYELFFFVAIVIFGSTTLHALFCRIFAIDRDTFMITSTAAICSPPFIPIVAGALKNPQLLLSGLTTGIIGYAIGNFLGIAIGIFFRSIL
ncbi:DUF819 family protein [Hazenella sp. IB182357]|uniref:DUF819 family protein n=1 Tax=Polycladospora coralii TaxID=2771432 RepID=A0A926NAZ2_9BACL|nr:DUF819 family protein [Polycladospora coralii]MBD1373163.1 DUF819 family protein [Polycladospora coralii]